MGVEVLRLMRISDSASESLAVQARAVGESGELPLAAFDGFPTAMLLSPGPEFAGSLHYMFFPRGAAQGFHHHPSPRYLVVVGDAELHVHYSDAAVDEDPRPTEQLLVVPAGELTVLRLTTRLWHRFSTPTNHGNGVLALTFHEDDGISDATDVVAQLMERETTFFDPARH